ncbi:MAG: 3-isopropylmalate dehydrogenase, partial [Thaumarchaeota archaeon]|nr:3-isopropylmalate dehydrogenase [Nitrososphaerota archaeon]
MYKISLITGDGIGPELSESVIDILHAINDKIGLKIEINTVEAGDAALKKTGKALPDSALDTIKKSDTCLKAPVGESAADVIVFLRRELNLYANIRPAKSYPNMPALKENIDLVIVRENTEDLYTGMEFEVGNSAIALRTISEYASKRIAKYACIVANQRNKQNRVTCVHKSNVM